MPPTNLEPHVSEPRPLTVGDVIRRLHHGDEIQMDQIHLFYTHSQTESAVDGLPREFAIYRKN